MAGYGGGSCPFLLRRKATGTPPEGRIEHETERTVVRAKTIIVGAVLVAAGAASLTPPMLMVANATVEKEPITVQPPMEQMVYQALDGRAQVYSVIREGNTVSAVFHPMLPKGKKEVWTAASRVAAHLATSVSERCTSTTETIERLEQLTVRCSDESAMRILVAKDAVADRVVGMRVSLLDG